MTIIWLVILTVVSVSLLLFYREIKRAKEIDPAKPFLNDEKI